ncbi:MAG: CopG family transcriptional regulator [Bacteroidetes bacterium]|nr:CopG family transcriptional regulator [Bacteroidota bacterium]MCH7770531.1 CopG family transcriptional regulator [Bacteroidota bacterium]MCH9029456.1 CopG family transcriptional regulator [Bacteroidota bacterium]
MPNLSKRATVYFDPAIHRVLKVKAAETSTSISDIIDKAIRRELLEDEEDLRAFKERASEPTISYDKLVADLKKSGKI